MHLNTEEINGIKKAMDDGYVKCRQHPFLELRILNYSNKCQFDNAFTPITEMCRGLIVDPDWNVIEKPFKKFYNLNERMTIKDLPDEVPIITEKLDGFMGICYSEEGMPAIASRGSFDSPMAIWATDWMRDQDIVMADFNTDFTYIFEIIQPDLCREHGLVVNYGARSECVLLAVMNKCDSSELYHITEARSLGLPFAKEYHHSLDNAIAEMPTMNTDQEGFVVRYSNGLRIKLKSDEYKRLTRLLKGLSPKRILNAFIESGDEGIADMLDGVPDETFARIHRIVDQIKTYQSFYTDEAQKVYDEVADIQDRSEQAKTVLMSPYKSIVFAMLNNKNYDKTAMQMVKSNIDKVDGDVL